MSFLGSGKEAGIAKAKYKIRVTCLTKLVYASENSHLVGLSWCCMLLQEKLFFKSLSFTMKTIHGGHMLS